MRDQSGLLQNIWMHGFQDRAKATKKDENGDECFSGEGVRKKLNINLGIMKIIKIESFQ